MMGKGMITVLEEDLTLFIFISWESWKDFWMLFLTTLNIVIGDFPSRHDAGNTFHRIETLLVLVTGFDFSHLVTYVFYF